MKHVKALSNQRPMQAEGEVAWLTLGNLMSLIPVVNKLPGSNPIDTTTNVGRAQGLWIIAQLNNFLQDFS